ncbi:MAG: alpha/beta fold hydrolase [Proteobacteria bacterium]|nr:alpha/beta fold hydrolase [Pseudomonadota bacterium]
MSARHNRHISAMLNAIRSFNRRLCVGLFCCLFAFSAPAIASYHPVAPMSKTSNGDVEIAYRVVGDESAEPILIVMGLSASHRVWNPQLIDGLAEGGYRVVLLDNRDVGESSRMVKKSKLWLGWQLLKYRIGLRVKSPYALSDMAADAVAVLDALNIERAHVVGASMGGMIGQIVAYDYPERTQSLVSIMSTTWAPHLPQPGQAQQEGISDMNESSEDQAADLEKMGFYPGALPNQVTAILSAGDRTDRVAQISAPALVLHGADDALLTVEHGEHTAATIPDATFKVYQDMGHNLPDAVIPEMVQDMLTHMRANPMVAQ